MTEISFLVDLFLNHKLPKATREAVGARIKEVERGMSAPVSRPAFTAQPLQIPSVLPPHMAGQSASTIAAMMRQEAGTIVAIPSNPVIDPTPIAPPQPVAMIAQTPAAAAALADRQAAIDAQITGRREKGRTSPRKF